MTPHEPAAGDAPAGAAKPYADIPGTTIFDSDMARMGYHVNQFCMSLMKAPNRERFLADEAAYLDEWALTEGQRAAVLARDYKGLIAQGANIYFLAKLFFTDGWSFEKAAAFQAEMDQDDYRAMMVAGGRSPEGNRFRSEWEGRT